MVGLLALGNEAALSWTAAVQIGLNIGFGDGESGRATIEDAAHATAVAFAERGYAKDAAESAGHAEKTSGADSPWSG